MAKLNVMATIKNRDGSEAVERTQGEDGQIITNPVTFRNILLHVVDSPLQGDESMDSKSKLRLWRLGQKIALEDECNFAAEDVTFILERANRIFGAAVYGRLVEALDPALLEA